MTRRAICVHGHFYQPSREDPFTGSIPREIGSEPFSNWNERINAYCYYPNAQIGNFEKISFNLGPTLTRWMEGNAPGTLSLIQESEKKNYLNKGSGNAIAQPYHHTILPLASRRDKVTQVRWGIADYEHTFGHAPEGMWLPETAVDLETLTVLAENDIRFTILAPWQAAEPIDATQSYRVELPGSQSICVFFYNSALSTTISFDGSSTVNADVFIQNYIKRSFSSTEEDQLLLVASDGELYGHHMPFRDKFLSYLLNGALSSQKIEYTTPGSWLQDHPPQRAVKIKELTSWSCAHGIERWRGECGCTPNGQWKQPLRQFFDAAAEVIDAVYLDLTREYLLDPWQARDDYIRVILNDQSYETWEREHSTRELNSHESLDLLTLMSAQFDRQRMYTSCGWFFEDFDRIEPENDLRYAAHALALAESVSSEDLISRVYPLLKPIRSWKTTVNAEEIFNKTIRQLKISA